MPRLAEISEFQAKIPGLDFRISGQDFRLSNSGHDFKLRFQAKRLQISGLD
jgi:hypothetical protein